MVQAPSTASTIGMTQGTPSSTPNTARLVLQIATTPTATTPITPILMKVRIGGGAPRPRVRRLWSLSHIEKPRPATTTPARTHEMVGSMVPHIRLYTVLRLLLNPWRLGYPENGPKARMMRNRPFAIRKPASVTMKDGRRNLVINVP